jgi:hypothetical protein
MRTAASLLAAFVCASAVAGAQIPAPRLEWGPWQYVTDCGGAKYSVSFSQDDGRNDVQVKLRVVNAAGRLISTRFKASLVSESGERARREGGSRINPGSVPLEGGPLAPAFHFGVLFPAAVNQHVPTRITGFTLDIDTADVSKVPTGATPSTYLSDFHDYEVQRCGPSSVSVPRAMMPVFASLTMGCFNELPKWTPPCDQAVDEIMAAYKVAPEATKPCIAEWRQFQKCYEIYAFERAPDPKPQCNDKIPRCTLSR